MTRPLGLYVHFPFCSVHCPYCDFAVEVADSIPHDAYADAIVDEIAARAPWFRGVGAGARGGLKSIYFGGGTPGLWHPAALARVIDAACAAFAAAASQLEITVEANPGEVDDERASAWRRAGVNRLSLGVQSFDDQLLAAIGRNHDGAAAGRALAVARAVGFDNVSCDLMFGLPGQAEEGWRRAVGELVALAPEHISTYALTVERGTPFGALDRAGKLPRPDDLEVAAMFEVAHQGLSGAGYQHYEVSSHARPGRRAVHNNLYWTGAAYLGVGASAASFRPLEDGTAWRFTNPRSTETYLRAARAGGGSPAPAMVERRDAAGLENEALWLGLRTSDGIDRTAHAARFGADPLADDARGAAARGCADAGWLTITESSVRPTARGLMFADEVAARLWR